jgi:hypothetical protein
MAMGQATVRLVKAVELLKRVLNGIHVSVDLVGVKFIETYKPLYEGLNEVKSEVVLPSLKAQFSFSGEKLSHLSGYQKI